jgi:hypothetical protein
MHTIDDGGDEVVKVQRLLREEGKEDYVKEVRNEFDCRRC